MKQFEYTITTHRTDDFNKVTIFCSQDGECAVGDIPSHQIELLKEILNEMGGSGWELVEIAFGKEGLMAFWKREVAGG